MAEEDRAKPKVGEIVYYFDPELIRRIGFPNGYGHRGVGPYAAIVVNDLETGLDLFVLYPEDQPAFVRPKVPEKPTDFVEKPPEKAYWDYQDDLQKARAVKRHIAKSGVPKAA